MSKKDKRTKPRNEYLHEILATVKPGKHKTDKRDQSKRRKDQERKEIYEGLS